MSWYAKFSIKSIRWNKKVNKENPLTYHVPLTENLHNLKTQCFLKINIT